MFIDDNEPVKTANFTVGEDLSKFSVDELTSLIQVLEEEKSRVFEELNKKKKTIEGAESVFK